VKKNEQKSARKQTKKGNGREGSQSHSKKLRLVKKKKLMKIK